MLIKGVHHQVPLPLHGGMVVDLFAGGGGASVGLERALGRVDIAINHDPRAIAMHEANHPQTHHYHCDVWEVDPKEATRGRPVTVLWASPDCTFFSKARGAKPHRDRQFANRRRALATVVTRWAKDVRPAVIMMENVEEFVKWGPLGDDGKPDKARAGVSFKRWAGRLRNLGYDVQWKLLRASDYGAATSRRRLFIVARCDGQRIVWPKPTHGEGLRPVRTAAEIIDWSIEGKSIFGRKRPLADATLRRIARGVQRFVIENKNPYFVIPTRVAAFLARHWGGMTGCRVDDRPYPTITTKGCQDQVVELDLFRSDDERERIGRRREVRAFLMKYYGTGACKGLDVPVDTLTTKGRFALVTIEGVDYEITDIRMRMLTPREMFRAQGFPDSYELDVAYSRSVGAMESNPKRLGITDQTFLVGNSVCPDVAYHVARANTRRVHFDDTRRAA